MAKATTLVNLLLLCCAFVSQGIVATGDEEGSAGADSLTSPIGTHTHQSPFEEFFRPLLADDVQINLIINQLAIIKLLNETAALSPGSSIYLLYNCEYSRPIMQYNIISYLTS